MRGAYAAIAAILNLPALADAFSCSYDTLYLDGEFFMDRWSCTDGGACGAVAARLQDYASVTTIGYHDGSCWLDSGTGLWHFSTFWF